MFGVAIVLVSRGEKNIDHRKSCENECLHKTYKHAQEIHRESSQAEHAGQGLKYDVIRRYIPVQTKIKG